MKFLTPAQYLEVEEQAGIKHEYFQGEVLAMVGGTPSHALIAANFIGVVRALIDGGPCTVYAGDLRVKVQATGLHTYPDASIICGQMELDTSVPNTVLNTRVLVEVLSDSTESYDRGAKASNYRKIESLQELLLVSQSRPMVECYTRTESGWLLTEVAGLEASIGLSSIEAEISLAELYKAVKFDVDETESANE